MSRGVAVKLTRDEYKCPGLRELLRYDTQTGTFTKLHSIQPGTFQLD
jgi:hypothetical protein